MKDMTKKERAEMWRQVAAYVEQLEQAVETQRAQLKRRQERINKLKARARAERTCRNVHPGSPIDRIMMFACSECGHIMTNHTHTPRVYEIEDMDSDEGIAAQIADQVPLEYCPNCGAKVVDE